MLDVALAEAMTWLAMSCLVFGGVQCLRPLPPPDHVRPGGPGPHGWGQDPLTPDGPAPQRDASGSEAFEGQASGVQAPGVSAPGGYSGEGNGPHATAPRPALGYRRMALVAGWVHPVIAACVFGALHGVFDLRAAHGLGADGASLVGLVVVISSLATIAVLTAARDVFLAGTDYDLTVTTPPA